MAGATELKSTLGRATLFICETWNCCQSASILICHDFCEARSSRTPFRPAGQKLATAAPGLANPAGLWPRLRTAREDDCCACQEAIERQGVACADNLPLRPYL